MVLAAAATSSSAGSAAGVAFAPPVILIKRDMIAHELRGLSQKDAKGYVPPGWFITKIMKRDTGWQVKGDGILVTDISIQ